MLLGEPQRTQADLSFVLFGIPVRVHPVFWFVAVILGARGIEGPMDLVVWVMAVFLAILIHELGHALVMRRFGFRPWITLYGLGGLASCDRGGRHSSFGHSALGQILISAAGPGAGFVLAGAIVGVLLITGHQVTAEVGAPYGLLLRSRDPIGSPYFDEFLHYVLFISVTWGLVNLLPVYPLDGGQIARELLLWANPREGIRQSLLLSVFTGAGMCLIGLVMWGNIFVGILFGYLAMSSYMTLQSYEGRGPW